MASDLIKLDMVDNLKSKGIKLERKRRKHKGIAKKLIALMVLIGLFVVGIKAYPYVKNIKLPSISFPENSDTPPNESADNNQQEGNNNDSTNNGNNDIDNDNTQTNPDAPPQQDETESVLPDGHFAIVNAEAQHQLVNNSACEIDFSKDFISKRVNDIYEIYGTGAPVILITHFASRECYSNGKSYTPKGVFYSNEKNIGSIGELMTTTFNSIGINAIHLNEVYSSGAIYSSRDEYEESLRKTLKAYPSIAYVINVSRDITVNDDMTMTNYSFLSNETQCAQITLTVGTNYEEITDLQEKNILFVDNLAKQLNSQHQGFVKSTEISRFELSQNIDPVCFNLEIGSYANTYEEASNTTSLFVDCFEKIIE